MQDNFPLLVAELIKLQKVCVLVSGGADSEVLLRAAVETLGHKNTFAFHAVTPFTSSYYTNLVKAVTTELGSELVTVRINTLANPSIKANGCDRCYHCKKAIYSRFQTIALEKGAGVLADGTNLDDTAEYRPGLRAAEEAGVHHPFLAAGMMKTDIRKLSRLLNMKNPERPQDSCLATRVPENTPILLSLLELVDRMEQPLRAGVKGRLRAKLTKTGVVLEYSSVDRSLVEAHSKTLFDTAESFNRSLKFHEIG